MSYDVQLNNGDVVIENGETVVCEDYDKLNQDLYRGIWTARGDNKFDSDEGMGIYNMLGQSMPQDLAQLVGSKDAYFGLQHMMEQQSYQATIQPLSLKEQIASLDGIVFQQIGLKKISINFLITTKNGVHVAFAYNVL
jgi:hypothetical protein